jgi:polygalacturonase
MSVAATSRRGFLSLTSAGVAGAALGLTAQGASAQTSPGNAAQLKTGGNAEVASDGRYHVRAFGAVGDGKKLDTPAINKAIEAANAAGGGTVYFASGTYLCHSIHLKDNLALYLDQGAVIVAADPPVQGDSGYDPPEPNEWDKYQDFGHSHWHNSLIWGESIANVSILGPGLIWGKGLAKGGKSEQVGGNKSIALKNCRNVILRDFSILHGGHFGILATGVENLTIDNLKIDTNRDGMNIDCCRNVRVSNCSVNSPWDDGICLKSCYGLGRAKSTEMVTITNCFVTGGYEEGTLLDGTFKPLGPDSKVDRTGRIKFGTESNGGFKNITISNCVFEKCQGLALETVDGALLEDVTITNITMRDIVSAPIFLRLGSRMRAPAGTPVGSLRRVTISNVVCSNSASRLAVIISGIPGHYVEDVKLSNIYVQYRGGGTKADAALEPEEKENAYPEPRMFGGMPSYGCFIRHTKAVEMTNVRLSYSNEDLRPALVLTDVRGADFFRIKAQHAPETPTFVLKNVEDFRIHHSGPVPDAVLEWVEQKTL